MRPGRNPLLAGGDLGAFLGVAQNLGLGDETVGMLAAWWRPARWAPTRWAPTSSLHDEAPPWGRWGLFDAMNVPELADRLFYEAETWLFEHTPGISGIRGPYSPEPLISPGLLTDGFDAQPVALLPYNPPYYPEVVEGQGYEPGPTWRAYALDLSAGAAPKPRSERVGSHAWQAVAAAYVAPQAVQPAAAEPQESLVPGLAAWLSHLGGGDRFRFNGSWERAMGAAFGRAVVSAVGEEDGGPAACFGIPDPAGALRLGGGRRLPLGSLLFELGLRRARRLHVFPAAASPGWDAGRLAELYGALIDAARAAGYGQAVVAPIMDENERDIEALTRIGAAPVQQFTIYEKHL